MARSTKKPRNKDSSKFKEREQLTARMRLVESAISVIEDIAKTDGNAAVKRDLKPANVARAPAASTKVTKRSNGKPMPDMSADCPSRHGARPPAPAPAQTKPDAAKAFGGPKLTRTNAEVEAEKRPGGVQLFKTKDTVANMPPRELSRCSCGVSVMKTPAEQIGHVRRSHPGGDVSTYFPDGKASASP